MIATLAQVAPVVPDMGSFAPWVQAGSAATIAMLFVWTIVWKMPKDEERRQQEIERRDMREDAIREWHQTEHEKTSSAFMTAVKTICDRLEDGRCQYQTQHQTPGKKT